VNTQLDVTYRHMKSSPTVEHVIREQLEKVERHCPTLSACRVVVTAPQGRHQKGEHFHVTVDLEIPGTTIQADPAEKHSHEDCHSAIRDAFRAALKEVDKRHSRSVDKRRRATGKNNA
jgi:ribosome-associated translation inhibitor RaiA